MFLTKEIRLTLVSAVQASVSLRDVSDGVALKDGELSGSFLLPPFFPTLAYSYKGFAIDFFGPKPQLAFLKDGTRYTYDGANWVASPTGWSTIDQIRKGITQWFGQIEIEIFLQRENGVTPVLQSVRLGYYAAGELIDYLTDFALPGKLGVSIELTRLSESSEDGMKVPIPPYINPQRVANPVFFVPGSSRSSGTVQLSPVPHIALNNAVTGTGFAVYKYTPAVANMSREYQVTEIPCILIRYLEPTNIREIEMQASDYLLTSETENISFTTTFVCDHTFDVVFVASTSDEVRAMINVLLDEIHSNGYLDLPPYGMRVGLSLSPQTKSMSSSSDTNFGDFRARTTQLTVVNMPYAMGSQSGVFNVTGTASITGLAKVGETLSVVIQDPNQYGESPVQYQWERSSDNGVTWVLINGATNPAYTPSIADLDKRLRVKAVYTDNNGYSESIYSPKTPAIASSNEPGVLLVPPTCEVGLPLSTNLSDPNGLPAAEAILYQWQFSANGTSNWRNILGATSSLYVPRAFQKDLFLRVWAYYVDAVGYEESVVSNVSGPVGATLYPGSLSVSGIARAEEILVAAIDEVHEGESYRWQSSEDGTNWADIAESINAQFEIPISMIGKYLRVLAVYVDGDGLFNQGSAVVGPVQTSDSEGTLAINGVAKVGQTLLSTLSDPDGITTPALYQWQISDDQANWADINGAIDSSYIPTINQIDKILRLQVSYIDDKGYSSNLVSTLLAPVLTSNQPGAISIVGTPKVGDSIESFVDDPNGLNGPVTYQWEISANGGALWVNIAGATSNAYTPVRDDISKILRVRAEYADDAGYDEIVVSSASAPVLTSNVPGVASVLGTPQAQQVLEASLNDPNGLPADVSYQWQVSVDGFQWANIPGATATTFIVPLSLIGQRVRLHALYVDNAGYSESVTSLPTGEILTSNVLGVPTLLGVAQVGQTLTASVSDVNGVSGPIDYQWERSGDENDWVIVGAGETYPIGVASIGRQLRFVATYTDDAGYEETLVSTASIPVQTTNVGGTVSILGTPQVGQPLEASVSDPNGEPTSVDYQWQRSSNGTDGWTNILGATNRLYSVPLGLLGSYLRIRAIYVDPVGYQEEIVSNSTTAILTSNVAGVATILGTPRVSDLLSVQLVDPNGVPDEIVYQWQISPDLDQWDDLSGADSAAYAPEIVQIGYFLRVRVQYTDLVGYVEDVYSSPTSAILTSNVTGSVAVSGTIQAEAVVSAIVSDSNGVPSLVSAIDYQWQISDTGTGGWTDIVGAIDLAYTILVAQVGKYLRIRASYIDNAGYVEAVTSAATAAIATSNTVGSLTITGVQVTGNSLQGVLTDTNGVPATVSYQWESSPTGTDSWTSVVGATSSFHMPVLADAGRYFRIRASYTDNAGYSETLVSLPTDAIVQQNIAGVVSIIGTVRAEETLTASVSDINGVPGSGISYQWQVSDNGHTGWSDIPGATSQQYIVLVAQVGKSLRVFASYTDLVGYSEAITSVSTLPVASSNTVGTVSISGVQAATETLTATVNDPNGLPVAVGYQWQVSDTGTDGWADLAGATSSTYLLTASQLGKYVRVQAFYTDNLGYNENIVSNPTGAIYSLNNPGSGTVVGTLAVGQSLQANVTDPDGINPPSANYAYQWQMSSTGNSGWTNISGATNSSLLLIDSYSGQYFRFTVTYTDALGNAENVTSSASGQLPANVGGTVNITGTLNVGSTLTANVNDASGFNMDTVAYQWQSSVTGGATWTNISGATNRTYTPAAGSLVVNQRIRVQATYLDNLGYTEVVVSNSLTMTNTAGTILVSGSSQVGQMLTATVSDANGTGTGAISYQWQRSSNGTNWTNISGATSQTYTLVSADQGQRIRATATYTDGIGASESVASAMTVAILGLSAVRAIPNAVDPTFPSGLFTWFRSDTSVTLSGSLVTRWNSRSVNTSHQMAPVGAGNGPTFNAAGGPNGFAFLDFDNVNDNLVGNFGTAAAAKGLAMMFRLTATPQDFDILFSSYFFEIYWWNNGLYVGCRNDGGFAETPAQVVFNGANIAVSGSTVIPAASVPLNTWHSLVVRRTSSGLASLYGMGAERTGTSAFCPVQLLDISNFGSDIGTTGANTMSNYFLERYQMIRVGMTLTATVLDPGYTTGTINYQWQSCPYGSTTWTNIAGAVSSTLFVSSTYSNRYLRVQATYPSGGSSATVVSGATSLVQSLWLYQYRQNMAGRNGIVSEADYVALETCIQAFISAGLLASQPSSHTKTASKILEFLPLMGGSLSASLLKVVNTPTRSNPSSATGLVEGDYSRATGILGAAGKHIDTGANISADWNNNTTGGFIAYVRSSNANTSTHMAAGANVRFYSAGGNQHVFQFPSSAPENTVIFNPANTSQNTGTIIAQRVSTTQANIWVRGTKQAEIATWADATLPTDNILAMAESAGVNNSSRAYGCFLTLASGLTDTQAAAATTAIDNFMASLGRAV